MADVALGGDCTNARPSSLVSGEDVSTTSDPLLFVTLANGVGCAAAKVGDLNASCGDLEAVDGLEGGLDNAGVDGREATRPAGTADALAGMVSVDLPPRSLFRSERRFRLGVAGRSVAAPRDLADRCWRD